MSERWTRVRLGDVAQIVMGQAPPGDTVAEEGVGLPFLQGNAEFGPSHPRAQLVCRRPLQRCEIGDMLVSVRAPVGALNQADRDYAIGRGLAAVRFRDVDPQYGRYALYRSVSQLRRVAQGTTFEAIGRRELVDVQLQVPEPRNEQRQIAEILDSVDKRIRDSTNIVAKLRTLKTGLVDALSRQHCSSISIGEVIEFVLDGVHHTPHYRESGVPFITVENLTRGVGLSFTPCRYISVGDHRIFSRRANPRAGDVLVSKDGTLGVARVVPEGCREFSIFVSVALLRPRIDRVIPEFLALFFEFPTFYRQLGGLSSGSGLKHIHLHEFRSFLIPSFSIADQIRFVKEVETAKQLIGSEEAEIEHLLLLRQGLMDDLLTGRVRVTEERRTERVGTG